MFSRDYRDIAGGCALIVVGLAYTWYAIQNYSLGVPSRMGPAMFPAGLGVVLMGLGTAIAILAFFKQGEMPEIRIRPALFVLLGVVAFTLLIPFGLIPAVVGVAVVSSIANKKISPFSIVALSAALSVLAWLIFSVGLRLPIAMFNLPF